jgi:hypothetical protein
MKGFLLVLIAAALVGAWAVAATPPRITVVTDGVTITSEKDVTVVVGSASVVACAPAAVAPIAATPSRFALKIPAWLGTPFARATLYILAGGAAVLILKWVQKKYGWVDKQMLTATIVVVSALGLGLSYLFQDKGMSLLSNPLNIGGGIGVVYTLANLAFKFWVQRAK